jgi:alpha-D-xyloside xylohydrolase
MQILWLALALLMQTPHRVTSFEHVNQEVVVKCDAGILAVKACADNIIQLRYYARSARIVLPQWGVVPSSAPVKYRVDSAPDAIMLATSQLSVSIDRKTAQVSFLDPKQNLITVSRRMRLEEFEENSYRIHLEFTSPDEEACYGLGQLAGGPLDRRGRTIRLNDESTAEGDNASIPFLITNRKYGLLFDNASSLTVTPGKEGVTAWDAESGDALSCYFIYGNNTDDIYRGYRALTGAAALPPRAALGYIQGIPESFGQEEVLKLGARYREKKFPVDTIAIESGGKPIAGARWPDPVAMNAELSQLGFATVASAAPRITSDSSHYETLETMGCIAKDQGGNPGKDARGALVDVSKPACAEWFWNDLQEHYLDAGFAGFWLSGTQSDLAASALMLAAGPGAKAYNYFPALAAKAISDGWQKDRKDRALILSRFAFLGAQRYSSQFGPIENPPQWNALAAQVVKGLNFSASALPWWASALGGPTATGADYAELYSRWIEFSAFCPAFRMQVPIPETEAAEQTAAKYLGLRARLFPYIYSLARRVSDTGAPVMRALFMDFPQDPDVRNIADEYMFGPAFLVAPVTQKGTSVRDVYLPKGAVWYDYWTGKKFQGGQIVQADAPVDTIPLFVRSGSLIPHAGENDIEIWVYSGTDGQFDLFRDETLIPVRWVESAQRLSYPGRFKIIK